MTIGLILQKGKNPFLTAVSNLAVTVGFRCDMDANLLSDG